MAVFDVIQVGTAGNSGADTAGSPVSLPATPTAGSLLLILAGQRSLGYASQNVPTGWTLIAGADHASAVSQGLALLGKISDGTETTVTFSNATPAGGAPESAIYAELEYDADALPDLVDQSDVQFTDDTTPTFGTVTAPDLSRTLLLAGQWKQPATPNPGPQTLTGFSLVADLGYAAFGNRHRLSAWSRIVTAGGTYGGGTLSAATDASEDGLVVLFALERVPTTDPGDPPIVLPPWNPPGPGGPILEIYTSTPGGDEWDTALWDTATWSARSWQAITPQSVTADVKWGAEDPDAGIIAQSVAGVWTVLTYDPDGDLDPGNEAGPFYPDVAPGTPIRLNHRTLTLRTGIIESVDYERTGGLAGRGRIRATDALNQALSLVPSTTILSDTLKARAREAIAAAGLSIPVFESNPTDPAVAPQLTGERSVRAHVLDAAEQILYFPWITRDGWLKFSKWGSPVDRGRLITSTNMIGLRTTLDDADRYSVVRVRNATDTATIERAYTPTPRYGRRILERSAPTIDPDGWAAAVLADRAQPALRYRPGLVRALTADDVDYFGTIEGAEVVGVVTDGVSAEGRVLGARINVAWSRDQEPRWSFTFQVYTTGTLALVADWTGEPLVSDDDADTYLTPDG